MMHSLWLRQQDSHSPRRLGLSPREKWRINPLKSPPSLQGCKENSPFPGSNPMMHDLHDLHSMLTHSPTHLPSVPRYQIANQRSGSPPGFPWWLQAAQSTPSGSPPAAQADGHGTGSALSAGSVRAEYQTHLGRLSSCTRSCAHQACMNQYLGR